MHIMLDSMKEQKRGLYLLTLYSVLQEQLFASQSLWASNPLSAKKKHIPGPTTFEDFLKIQKDMRCQNNL